MLERHYRRNPIIAPSGSLPDVISYIMRHFATVYTNSKADFSDS